jgi:hypothetical protein
MSKHPNKRKFVTPEVAKSIDPKNIFYSYGVAIETLPHKKEPLHIRYAICGIYDKGVFTIGVARCSHKDKYVRSKGRELSLERAVNSPVKITIPTETPGKDFRSIAYLFANPKFTNIIKHSNEHPLNTSTMERVPELNAELSESQIH